VVGDEAGAFGVDLFFIAVDFQGRAEYEMNPFSAVDGAEIPEPFAVAPEIGLSAAGKMGTPARRASFTPSELKFPGSNSRWRVLSGR